MPAQESLPSARVLSHSGGGCAAGGTALASPDDLAATRPVQRQRTPSPGLAVTTRADAPRTLRRSQLKSLTGKGRFVQEGDAVIWENGLFRDRQLTPDCDVGGGSTGSAALQKGEGRPNLANVEDKDLLSIRQQQQPQFLQHRTVPHALRLGMGAYRLQQQQQQRDPRQRCERASDGTESSVAEQAAR